MSEPIAIIDLEAIAARRKSEVAALKQSGVDEDLISKIVEAFYSQVRLDSELGPIFESELEGRWEEHLSKMKMFWEAIIFKSGTYKGHPVQSHVKLVGVNHEHFNRWMNLFELTVRELCPSPNSVQYFLDPASKIAIRLQSAMKICVDR